MSFLVGGTLTTVGLVFLWAGIPHSTVVVCDRLSNNRINCLYQEQVLWWIVLKQSTLENLQSASLQKGENAYDGTLYRIFLDGESSDLGFGNSLDLEKVESDLEKTQAFLDDATIESLRLRQSESAWLFVLLGLPIAALGIWTLTYKQPNKA